VYRAWDRERGGWVALKILNERQSNNAAAHARFIAEGRTMLALDHRYLIGTYGAIDGRRPFLVLEVAEGGSLKQWVDKHGRMPERMAADVAIQICKGIGAAHQHGVIHRDVKPHNVLINRRGSCKVTDFGIARILRDDGAEDVPDATATDDRMGTIGYMAPEQRSDPRLVDPRTDVYGIGATLVHLVTGRPPLSQLFYADRDRELIADVPEALTPIVLRATAFRPDARFASVADLARALHEVRSKLPPIPVATPNLTADLPPEPPPPVGATVSTHNWDAPSFGSESSLDSNPLRTPNSVSGREKPVTTPPPAALRRASQEATPTPVPESRRTTVRWGIALGLVIGWTLVGLVVAALWVNAAAQGVVRAQDDFARLVAREAGVVEDLAGLGADRAALVGALEQYRAARAGPLAFDRATALVETLDAARDTHAGPGVREERAARASGGVDDLEQGLESWREALRTWQGRARSGPGRIVQALRLR
jgi:serine/threonine protein kinase